MCGRLRGRKSPLFAYGTMKTNLESAFMKNINILLLSGAVFAVLIGECRIGSAADDVLIEVSSGKYSRENCVISCSLPKEFQTEPEVHLVSIESGQTIPAQIDRFHKETQLVWILENTMPEETTRKYKLRKGPGDDRSRPHVQMTSDDQQVIVVSNNKPVLKYNMAIVKSPIRGESYYDKSGYIHPLYTPSGEVITDDFNPDHPHQHGIMFAWRKVIFEGRESNGWDQKSQSGEVVHRKLGALTSGPVFGRFSAQIDHVDLTGPDGPVTVLHEIWNVRVYAIQNRFLFDLESVQKCAADKPVTIAKIHYGGMTLRGRADWAKRRDYNYLTSDGNDKSNGNQTRPQWVEMYGPVGNHSAGVTMLCDPRNFCSPQPVRLHPTMPYLCFAVAALDEFSILPGTPYVSRYRVAVHDGKGSSTQNQQLWNDFTDPPVVSVVPSVR